MTPHNTVITNILEKYTAAVQRPTEGGRGLGGSNFPEIPKTLQDRAKLNQIVKTVKNC